MKKISLSLLTLAFASAAWAQPLDRSIKPKPGPAPEIKLGKSETFTLPNGMKVFVVENHKLPTIACTIELDIRPELQGEMAGYRDMMSELLLSGTTTRSKDKLNGEIDQMGAEINVSDEGLSGSCLKKYQEKTLELMADIAMNSVIKQEELDKTKKKNLSGLETEKNQPDAMVRNVSAVVNFGNKHPYGEVATEESIKKITLERCNNYYQTYFRPNVAYMAIVGDVTLAEIKPLIEKYFGKWQQKNVPIATYMIPAMAGTTMTKVAFAPRTAAVQSVVSVTYPVILQPGSEDVTKARVANTVLGGGSQGRLFLDLREKHAWTYGAYSNLHDDALGGSFSATVKCRNIVSDSAVGAIIDEMRMMQTQKVNDTALQNSITYLSGSFAIGLEDPNRVAQNAINIERYHMPKDFYQNYLKNLSAVTANDVMNMSIKYIRPDHANIVVAGSKDEVANKLAKFSADGKIDYYDYTGKSIVPEETAAAPTDMTAEKVFNKYLAAMGGDKAINSIKDIKITGSTSANGMILQIMEEKKAPNMWAQSIDRDMQGKMMTLQKQAYNGTKGYQEAGGRKEPLEGNDLNEVMMSADLAQDLHPEKYGIIRLLKGIEQINGSKAYVLAVVNGKGKKSTEYY
ncbi:MAG: processing peptidase, partial [Flavipsychrobacter sp.]|nr:processing peptidase [Flavipsychrobacter sp.]